MAIIDPVCRMAVDPASAPATAVIEGQPVYFCSDSCRNRYLANPSAYPLADPARHKTQPRQGPSAVWPAIAGGIGASAALLVLYFALLAALSGWDFTRDEFARYWPYIVTLAGGFGIQVGLFLFLRGLMRAHHAGKVVAVTGGTSGAAMVSCCSHYLVNLLPALGATGLISLIGQYQVELFWVGIAANLAGIAYVGRRLLTFLNEA
jgi:YHS domain-containing protein